MYLITLINCLTSMYIHATNNSLVTACSAALLAAFTSKKRKKKIDVVPEMPEMTPTRIRLYLDLTLGSTYRLINAFASGTFPK